MSWIYCDYMRVNTLSLSHFRKLWSHSVLFFHHRKDFGYSIVSLVFTTRYLLHMEPSLVLKGDVNGDTDAEIVEQEVDNLWTKLHSRHDAQADFQFNHAKSYIRKISSFSSSFIKETDCPRKQSHLPFQYPKTVDVPRTQGYNFYPGLDRPKHRIACELLTIY